MMTLFARDADLEGLFYTCSAITAAIRHTAVLEWVRSFNPKTGEWEAKPLTAEDRHNALRGDRDSVVSIPVVPLEPGGWPLLHGYFHSCARRQTSG